MTKDRIASLDGVRGIAITLVVLQHARLTLPPVPLLRDLLWPVADGHLGVSVFFVLSGYLITRIMRTEHERTGTVSLRSFYFRRAFRILPAYFAFLSIMFLARHFGGLSISDKEFLGAASFTRNYVPPDLKPWWLAHCWSLSVEEQFYLAWPLAISFIGLRRGAWLAVALVLSGPLVRVASYLLLPQWRGVKGLDTSFDVLMTGCALALLEGLPRFESLLGKILQRWVLLLAPLALISCRLINDKAPFGTQFTFLFGITIENVAIMLLIAWIIRKPA
ncbi:MAG TPA: acyltransferase, partial [Polyangia bacterium]